jgi:hypothetical protein
LIISFDLEVVQIDIKGTRYEVISSMPSSLHDFVNIFIAEFHFHHHLMSANGLFIANGLLLLEPAI